LNKIRTNILHPVINDETLFIGLHIRRGIDLLWHQRNQRYGHTVAPKNYYYQAMEYFEDLNAGRRIIFVTATDNLAWAKKNIIENSE
jgi:hypothetical protein